MARRKRDSELDLNFDGLTDTVTNLVGNLLLIVVLLIGITRDAVYSPPTPTPAATAGESDEDETNRLLRQAELLRALIDGAGRQMGELQRELPELRKQVEGLLDKPKAADPHPENRGNKTLRATAEPVSPTPAAAGWPIVTAFFGYQGEISRERMTENRVAQSLPLRGDQRAELLRAHVRECGRELQSLDNGLPAVRSELQELTRLISSLQSASAKPPAPRENAGAKVIEFRPPLAYVSTRPNVIAFVCENNAVTAVDLKEVTKGILQNSGARLAAREKAKESGVPQELLLSTPNGAFDAKSVISNGQQGLSEQLSLARKSGFPGETVARSSDPNSEFAKVIGRYRSENTLVQFAVYPDSYECFRELRSRLWKIGFEIYWHPVESGGAPPLGSGQLGS